MHIIQFRYFTMTFINFMVEKCCVVRPTELKGIGYKREKRVIAFFPMQLSSVILFQVNSVSITLFCIKKYDWL